MLGQRDLYNNVKAAVAMKFATRTANATGEAIDLTGYGSALIVIATGTITDGNHAFALKESDDNATYTAVGTGDLIGTAPTADATADDKVYKLGYRGRKRYIRLDVTVTGATAGGVYGAVAILGRPEVAPVA